MHKNPTYNLTGKLQTRSDLIIDIHKRAEKIEDPETRKSFLSTFAQILNQDLSMEKTDSIMQKIVMPIIGIAGLVAMVAIVYFNPFPSMYQSGVYWLVLALLSAFFATLLPGFIEFKYQKMIKAGGAFAMMFIIYFFKPAAMSNEYQQNPLTSLTLYVAKKDSADLAKIPIDFNSNTSTSLCDFTHGSLSNYYGTSVESDSFTCYRKSDGKIYSKETCKDITESDIIMISKNVSALYSNKRDAYLHFLSIIK